MQVLTKDEVNMLTGGGESSVDTRTRRNNGGRGASTNYGGQANGFVSGPSAQGMTAECAKALGLAIAGGTVGGLIAKGARAVAGNVVGGSIASLGSCFGNGGSGNGSQNASNKGSGGYNGGTCNW
ncbi:hypothetical protein [Serratia inhibens]|uniref:hypothetical protein n=1 Tax=Serratia inhibens TaxID=2338073 RepID=UPI00321744C4